LRQRPQYEDLTDAIVWAFVLGQLGINVLAGVKSRRENGEGYQEFVQHKQKGTGGAKGGVSKSGMGKGKTEVKRKSEERTKSKDGSSSSSSRSSKSSVKDDDSKLDADSQDCPETEKLTHQVNPMTLSSSSSPSSSIFNVFA